MLDEFLYEELTEAYGISYTMNRLDQDPVLALSGPPSSQVDLDRIKTFTSWDDLTKIPLFLVLGFIGKGIPFATEVTSSDLPPVRFMDTLETGEDDEFGDPDEYLWDYPDFPEDVEITY